MLQSKYQQILHPIYGLSLLKYWLVHISYNKSEYSYVEGGGGGGGGGGWGLISLFGLL